MHAVAAQPQHPTNPIHQNSPTCHIYLLPHGQAWISSATAGGNVCYISSGAFPGSLATMNDSSVRFGGGEREREGEALADIDKGRQEREEGWRVVLRCAYCARDYQRHDTHPHTVTRTRISSSTRKWTTWFGGVGVYTA